MGGIIRLIMSLLAMLVSLYSVLIFIRILLTWFSSAAYSQPVKILAAMCDPYLNWWRRNVRLNAGAFDLSPIAALAALSVVQTICNAVVRQGSISLGFVLVIFIYAVWSAVSFLLGFGIVILILRFIGYMANANMYSPFWQVIDAIAQPLLYRISRIFFGKRIVRFLTGIFTAVITLAGIWVLGRYIIQLLAVILLKLPF